MKKPKVGVKPKHKLSKDLKRLKKVQRLRLKKIKDLAKILKSRHKLHQQLNACKLPVSYITKTGLTPFFRFEPAYPLLNFKSDSGNGWKLVKTCRLPSLLTLTFNVVLYVADKDYFKLRCPDLCGTLNYHRLLLYPVIRKKKRITMVDFILLASAIIRDSEGKK